MIHIINAMFVGFVQEFILCIGKDAHSPRIKQYNCKLLVVIIANTMSVVLCV